MLEWNRITATLCTNCRFVHDDIAKAADDLIVTFVIARRTTDFTGIQTDAVRIAALQYDDKPNLLTTRCLIDKAVQMPIVDIAKRKVDVISYGNHWLWLN